jgi:PAS domain S-box-containing protein
MDQVPAREPIRSTGAAAIAARWELEAIYRDANVGLALFDTELRFVRINASLAAMNGLPVSDHIGRHISDVVPALAHQAAAVMRRILQTGEAVHDFEFVGETHAAPGVERSWREHWLPVHDGDGRIVGAVAMVEETTELRRLSRENRRVSGALARSEARHAFLLRFSDALRRLTDPEELVGHGCALLGEHLQADRVGFAELVGAEEVLVHREFSRGVASTEGRHRTADYGARLLDEMRAGRIVHYASISSAPGLTEEEKAAHRAFDTEALVVAPVFDAQLLAGMFFVNVRHARMWTADDLDVIEAGAKRTFEALARTRAECALREADQRKDEFLATLAHELRNPLAPIRNAVKLLEREPALTVAGERAVTMIARQAAQMRHLVEDLLEVSRISRGVIELKIEPVGLGAAVLTAVDAARPDAQAKGQSLEAVVPRCPVILHADPIRIAQVLENLIGNAIKYTPEGGSIRVEVGAIDGFAEIRVIDDGIGIEPTKLERIFELFVQAQPGVGAHQGGLGIGLALVRRLVELHGGTVCALSKGPELGATFVVRLPLPR